MNRPRLSLSIRRRGGLASHGIATLELAWIEDFLVLLEVGTFSRAAERRNVTQPAFGRRIRSLEHWVGATLFDRSNRRVVPTAAALAFRPEAEEALRRLEGGRLKSQEVERAGSATLVFASTHLLSSTFFPRWLPLLEDQLGVDIRLQFLVDNMAACERLLRRGEARLLLCHHHADAGSELDERAFQRLIVGRDTLVPVSKADERGRPLHPVPEIGSDDRIATLFYRRESGLGRILRRTHALDGLEDALEPVFHAHATLTLAALARQGRGLAWLPMSAVRDDLEAGRLVRALDSGSRDLSVEICLVRPAARQSAPIEAFWRQAQGAAQSS